MDAETFKNLEKAIKLATGHIVKRGSDDIFRPPLFATSLEHCLINDNVSDFEKLAYAQTLKFINRANLSEERIGPVISSLIAKDDRSFRRVMWMDPFDAVKYLSVCLLLFEKIESARVDKSKLIIHSHRKSDMDDIIFDPSFGYDSFRAASGALSREREGKWKVVTDISNFFDRIGNHSLENHLLDIGCDRRFVTLLREMLFFWAGDRRSFGVPVGSDASRIISEAILIDIDKKLCERGVTFVRYVDDFRLFADTRAEAYAHIELLTSLLADEGLSLNGKKTDVYQIVDNRDTDEKVNRIAGEEHEVINVDERVEVKFKFRVSGRTQISRYYKEPGQEAVKKIKDLDKNSILSDFLSSKEDSVEDKLKLIIKYFVYADQDVHIIKSALDKKITSIFYICDALVKEEGKFSDIKKLEILKAVQETVDWDKAPYPYQIPILRLTAARGFYDNKLLYSIIDNHRMTGNALFFREVVALSYEQLDRTRLRALAMDAYAIAPNFVKRAIFHAVANHPTLATDEKRPLLKNLQQHTEDWFLNRIKQP